MAIQDQLIFNKYTAFILKSISTIIRHHQLDNKCTHTVLFQPIKGSHSTGIASSNAFSIQDNQNQKNHYG